MALSASSSARYSVLTAGFKLRIAQMNPEVNVAILSDLVQVCAEHRIDKIATLNLFARHLREAGRIKQKGRGRGAAIMSFRDAARFLIACAATDQPALAADAELTFSNMVWSDSGGLAGARDWLSQETEPTLDAALASMLGAIGAGEVDRYQQARAKGEGWNVHSIVLPAILELHLHRDASGAVLRFCEREYRFQHPTMAAVVAAKTYDETQVLMAAFERETYRFRSGKHLRAELDASLLRAVAKTVHVEYPS